MIIPIVLASIDFSVVTSANVDKVFNVVITLAVVIGLGIVVADLVGVDAIIVGVVNVSIIAVVSDLDGGVEAVVTATVVDVNVDDVTLCVVTIETGEIGLPVDPAAFAVPFEIERVGAASEKTAPVLSVTSLIEPFVIVLNSIVVVSPISCMVSSLDSVVSKRAGTVAGCFVVSITGDGNSKTAPKIVSIKRG